MENSSKNKINITRGLTVSFVSARASNP